MKKLTIIFGLVFLILFLLKGYASAQESFSSPQEAINYYKQQLESEPQDVDILQKLGDNYWRAKRYVEAVDVFEKIVGLQPSNSLVHLYIAELYDRLGAQNLSLKEFETAIPLMEKEAGESNNIEKQRILYASILKFAVFLEKTGMPERAMEQYEKLKQILDKYPTLQEYVPFSLKADLETRIRWLKNRLATAR